MTRAAGAALLGLSTGLAAAAFDSASLYVLAATLVLLGVGSGVWVAVATAGASIERSVGPRTVEEEEGWPVRLRFRSGLVPPPAGDLVEPLLAEPIGLALRSRRQIRVVVRFSARGRRVLEPPRAILRDPLGLASATVTGEGGGEVIVLPRVEPVLAPSGGDADVAISALVRPTAAASSELELDSLRPYRPGAPAARIHWPTVARTGELIERRFVAESGARPLVVLDGRPGRDPEALDMAVRAAASLTVRLARAGGCAILLPGERRPIEVDADLRTWHPLHVRLALLEPRADPPAAARLGRAGAVVWVAARADVRLPDALRAGKRFVVAPGPSVRGPAAFEVAGCSGVELGRARQRYRPRIDGEAA